MAMVCLSDLFAKDKNFYGLLDENITVKVTLSEKFKKYFPKEFFEEFEKYSGKEFKIKDLFEDSFINEPEWLLNEHGKLYNFSGGLYEIEGELVFAEFFEIDICHWLKTLDKETLHKIADYTFYKWEGGNRNIDVEKQSVFFNTIFGG